ncbi:MAG TPA: helix-turn-helix domain-containing protein, partial [Roseiflexaceae bacterium]|nr:helix-turn-helix domain-containing protein [Roseiflexaceae bacterium]
MEDVYSFGAWMRHRRKGLRLTQAELASSVGVATVTIHKIESDERRPSLQVATLLAEHLQLPPGLRDAFLLAARGGCLPDRLPDIAPAVKPSAVPGEARGYLPVRVTSFVGREQEIRTLNAQLQSGDIRLITLVGAGGSGKTSLALQVSSRLAEYFPGGVWFVDLSAVTDPAQVAVTMTQALGIPQRSDITPHAQIMLRLRMARALVLLDNCEHLLEAVAMLAADLMRAAPGVTLLATSRAPLRVQGEHEIVVVPLAFPDSQYLPELDALAEYDALRLFCERARAVQASFQLCAANMLTVAEICARLDGMPLAIELAVAWLRVFTPQELLVRLENAGLDVLTSGVRDLPERHRTVRATIVWSEQLLGPHEQTLLARLGVFAGSWTLEAAEVVCADEEVEVVSCLDTLLQHSLVQRQDAHSGSRFTLLDTVRTFARERLATSGDERRLRERYACYYVTLAESTLRNAIDPPDRSGIDVLDHELENMRAVLRWAVAAHEKLPIELGLRLMVATHLYWEIHAGRPEGHQWFQRLFVHAEQVEPRLRLAATLAVTELHKFFDAAGAWAMLESIEQPIAHSGDRQLQLVFHSYAGWSELFLHRREAAIARWKAALQQLDAQDGMCWQAEFHWGIGFAYYFLRRLEQSERHLRASLRLSQAYNNLYVASENLHWMALTLA